VPTAHLDRRILFELFSKKIGLDNRWMWSTILETRRRHWKSTVSYCKLFVETLITLNLGTGTVLQVKNGRKVGDGMSVLCICEFFLVQKELCVLKVFHDDGV